MQKLKFLISIDAPVEKVWKVMLEDKTYREWTEPFHPGSYYEGSWDEGSKILFLAPEGGKLSGMVSRIKENRPYEYISIEHLGMVEDGKEITEGPAVDEWKGVHENYTFKEKGGKTDLKIELDAVGTEYEEMFKEMWPKALKKLKEIAES